MKGNVQTFFMCGDEVGQLSPPVEPTDDVSGMGTDMVPIQAMCIYLHQPVRPNQIRELVTAIGSHATWNFGVPVGSIRTYLHIYLSVGLYYVAHVNETCKCLNDSSDG